MWRVRPFFCKFANLALEYGALYPNLITIPLSVLPETSRYMESFLTNKETYFHTSGATEYFRDTYIIFLFRYSVNWRNCIIRQWRVLIELVLYNVYSQMLVFAQILFCHRILLYNHTKQFSLMLFICCDKQPIDTSVTNVFRP